VRIHDWFRLGTPAPAVPPAYAGAMMAMIALAEAHLPTAAAIFGYARARWPDLPLVDDLCREDDVVTFSFARGRGVIGLAPLPIPGSHLLPAFDASSGSWPAAPERLHGHPAHLLLTVRAPALEPVSLGLHFTRLMAASCHAARGLGVLWVGSGLVHAPEVLLRAAHAMSRDRLPLHLWVGFHERADPNGTPTLATSGLSAFGLPELEVVGSRRSPREVRERVFDLAYELLDRRSLHPELAHIFTNHARLYPRRSVHDERRTVFRVEW
jgi:hypothetical protein